MHRARATQRWRRAARPRSSRSRLWAGATTRRARRPTCTCRCFSSTCWRSCRATTRLRKGSPSPRRRSLCAFRGLSEGAGPAGSSSSSSLRARRGETARPLTPPPSPTQPNTTKQNKPGDHLLLPLVARPARRRPDPRRRRRHPGGQQDVRLPVPVQRQVHRRRLLRHHLAALRRDQQHQVFAAGPRRALGLWLGPDGAGRRRVLVEGRARYLLHAGERVGGRWKVGCGVWGEWGGEERRENRARVCLSAAAAAAAPPHNHQQNHNTHTHKNKTRWTCARSPLTAKT